MSIEVIVTVGPSLTNNEHNLRGVDEAGPCIYRINGAHASAAQAADLVAHVRAVLPNARLMIDLPGNKVRTRLTEPLRLTRDAVFCLYGDQLNYPEFYRHLKAGDILLAHDSIYRLEVVSITGTRIDLRSHSDGVLLSNKGLHLPGVSRHLPFLYERDRELIRLALEVKVDYVSLSFVRDAQDVAEAQALLREGGDRGTQIIAKIETASAVENLDGILDRVDIVNVDRGDLSTDIGLLNLPGVQARVVEAAKARGKRIFLATQFLRNMESHPVPVIAEMMDLYRTLQTGVAGIQLSEETAVGEYPVECVRLTFDVCRHAAEHASGQ